MQAVPFTLIPVVAVLIGSLIAVSRRPSDAFVSAMQHLAAGVVLAGGALGVLAMLSLKALEGRASGWSQYRAR